jgi:hypothetical protein
LDIFTHFLELKATVAARELIPFNGTGYHWARSETPCAWIKWDFDGRCEIALNIARKSDDNSDLCLTVLRWDAVLDERWQRLAEDQGFRRADDSRFEKQIVPSDLAGEIKTLVAGINKNRRASVHGESLPDA